MESQTKNAKTRTQIAALANRAFGTALADDEDAVQELKDGWFNAAYQVRLAGRREVILKIAPPPGAEVMQYEQNIMLTEVVAMRLARQNPAIPVPEIYFFDQARDLCDSDYFFMEKVQGDSLEHVKDTLPPDTLAAVQRQIGGIIHQINAFPGLYFGYEGNPDLRAANWKDAFLKIMDAALEDAARKGATLDYRFEELRAVVQRHAPALEEVTRPCLVHWDAWNPNFFVRDGKVVGIIDFERALWAEPLMEAQFRTIYAGEGVNQAMIGYGKTTFTPAEERRSHLYALHLALVMHVECYYRHYGTDSIFTFSRRYIAETMDWLRAN